MDTEQMPEDTTVDTGVDDGAATGGDDGGDYSDDAGDSQGAGDGGSDCDSGSTDGSADAADPQADSDPSGGMAGYATDSLTSGLGGIADGLGGIAHGLGDVAGSLGWAAYDGVVEHAHRDVATLETLGAGMYSYLGQDEIAQRKLGHAEEYLRSSERAHQNLLKDVGLKPGEREHLGTIVDPAN